ncbi:DUF4838 domain-containing protein [Urbifossiella limnaea]|uniref:Glycosyl hydrolases family 2, sugar binding domain n=1 Tax=Urbifossiella limnaea TaxID=2528023 RepID=A0A517XWZ7_9BACT|nr:DUF4838 domain-containing protein [Urbifossiella limnaea]QDU22041.1 Glycosyl hydrolases family 2, sugar binding domain [Urbifossiella limnaea]
MSRLVVAVGFLLLTSPAFAADLAKGGKSLATIVINPGDTPKAKSKVKALATGDAVAAQLLADWLGKMVGAPTPVQNSAPAAGTPIYVGRAAVAAGLKLDDIDSRTKEGVRIVVEANRVLIAGQSDAATLKAVCRFLEHLGCRYFMDTPLGEVFPHTPDLTVAAVTITEKPGLLYRNPKGPTWPGGSWKSWNGAGGEDFAHAHSWGRYIPKGLFAEHPEYFAMGADGKRKDGDWLCTSNPGVRGVFAKNVVAAIKAGARNPSISPPDGRGYCQCPACKAQDDPKVIEPSSGSVAVSTRYADFFDDVARRVAKEAPDVILNFYVYADYTQPPTRTTKLAPNLCAVIAPIRYCRLHALGDPNCPSRKQAVDMIDGWARVAPRLGYYNYMYNLADATLPTFKFTPCRLEFPLLADRGLAFMTIEVLSNWHLYGPQIYLSLRMAYDPRLDPVALMDDYFTKFYGPAAAPMKAYWMGIDGATAVLPNHAGGFYGMSGVYTDEFVRACESRLKQASDAATGVYAERVALHAAGFQNVIDYRSINEAMARGDFRAAKTSYDRMTARIDVLSAKRHANPEYGTAYLRRFLSKAIDGGLTATAAPTRVVAVLPDRWKFAPDDKDDGEAKGFASPTHDDTRWRQVATYSNTLSGQGLEENTVLWYRTTVRVPVGKGSLALVFPEVDGPATVYVNGKAVEAEPILPNPKAVADVPRRAPFRVPPGDAVVAVRVDNRRISELFLGGILRPVVLVEAP